MAINLTEEEQRFFLKQAGKTLPSNASGADVNQSFLELLQEIKSHSGTHRNLNEDESSFLRESAKAVEIAELMVTVAKAGSHAISSTLTPEVINAVQTALTQVPWATLGMTAGKFLVASSSLTAPVPVLAVMAGVELLMLLRYSRGTGLQLTMMNLFKAPGTIAQVAMTTINFLIKNSKDVVLHLEGSGSKVFNEFSKELTYIAEKMGFEFDTTEHQSPEKTQTKHLSPLQITPQ